MISRLMWFVVGIFLAAASPAAWAQAASLVKIIEIAGPTDTIPGGSDEFVFVSETATVSITRGQRLTATASLPVRLPNGFTGSMSVRYQLCYKRGAAAIQVFKPGYHQVASVVPSYTVFSSSMTTVPARGGTYKVGFCVSNPNATNVVTDSLNGWVMVSDD